MKKTLTLLISFFVFTINAQEKTVKDSLKTKGLEVWEWHYDNGVLGEKGYLKDSLKEGEWKWFFENEQLKAKGSYKLGKPTGSRSFYYPKGDLYCKGQYTDGKRDGKWIWYYENSKVKNTIVFDKDIVKSYAVFDETGTKIVKSKGSKEVTVTFEEPYSYSNQFKLSIYNPNAYTVSFFENGELEGVTRYKKGKKNGKFIAYYNNGTIFNKGAYRKDLKYGKWEEYYESGQLKSSSSYNKSGVLDGVFKGYYENGNPKGIATFKKGEKNGESNAFFENGQLKSEGKYKNGKQIGWFTYYKEDGKPKRASSYQAETEREDGEKLYYKNGQLKVLKLYHRPGVVAWEYYYPNGSLKGLFYFLGREDPNSAGYYDQEKTGVWKHFAKDGALLEEITFEHDKMNGKNIRYYNNKVHNVLLWEDSRLKEVLSCVDVNGNPLPKGTLKDGNGEVFEYYKAAKLMNKVLIKDGKVADGHFFIRMVWNNQKKLNSYAWDAFQYALTAEELDWAIIWIERAIALEKNYHNMDTYAALLFKTGKKKQALKIANEAIAIAKKEDIDYKATEKLIEKFNK